MKTNKPMMAFTLLGLLLVLPCIQPIHADSSNNVVISNLQVQPSIIHVGDNFTISATLVNNSTNAIQVHNDCISPFSANFDSHAEVIVNKPCIYFAISIPIQSGHMVNETGPGSNLVYKAIAAGVANATVTFSYTPGNQTGGNFSFTGNPVSISKSVQFTVYDNNTRQTPSIQMPLEQVMSGISPQDVKCNQGFQLIFKAENNSPACVRPDAAAKLMERGWAKNSI